jgi:hypothetical protein
MKKRPRFQKRFFVLTSYCGTRKIQALITFSNMQDMLPESIRSLLGANDVGDLLNKIQLLKRDADRAALLQTQNTALLSLASELGEQNEQLSVQCQAAESKIQDLTCDVEDLETVLEETETQFDITRKFHEESEMAHAKHYESMHAELLWEIQQTKQIAAEEIINASKLGSAGNEAFLDKRQKEKVDGTIILSLKSQDARILRLSEIAMESGPLEHERVGALTGKIHLYVEEIRQLQLRLLENEKFKELSQSAYLDKLEISEKKIDELHSQLHKTVSERQQLVDENHRLNLTLSTRLRTQEMYENQLLKKIVRTIQNTAVYRAWTKWKNEAKKSSFMKRIAKRMLNASAVRSFQKWNQVSQESKFNKMEDELRRKTKENEALEFKITNMTGQLAIRNEQLQKIHESHQEAPDLRGQVTLLKQQASLEKENYDLRVHTAVLQNQMQGAVAQKDADAFRLHEVIDLQAQVSLMKTRLDDLAGQVVLKDEILATLEQRNQTQLSTIIELESTISVSRQKFNALEKEVALGAAHSSMLFKELKETRSKLSLSSEQNLHLQEKQSGLIRRLDGTSGSIQALWRERESDLEV